MHSTKVVSGYLLLSGLTGLKNVLPIALDSMRAGFWASVPVLLLTGFCALLVVAGTSLARGRPFGHRAASPLLLMQVPFITFPLTYIVQAPFGILLSVRPNWNTPIRLAFSLDSEIRFGLATTQGSWEDGINLIALGSWLWVRKQRRHLVTPEPTKVQPSAGAA